MADWHTTNALVIQHTGISPSFSCFPEDLIESHRVSSSHIPRVVQRIANDTIKVEKSQNVTADIAQYDANARIYTR
jgi:hypothetical protein